MSDIKSVSVTTTNPYLTATDIADLQRRIYQAYGIQPPSFRAGVDFGGKTHDKPFDTPKDKPFEMPEDKWVWVTGYKGMDKNMKCRNDFQYEIGKTYDMPEDAEIKICSSGFHFCLELKDVFDYQDICNGHRFFEVRALVRERDKWLYVSGTNSWYYTPDAPTNKLAAKSIEIVRELSADEILAHIPEAAKWPSDIKERAIEKGVDSARAEFNVYTLIKMGYSPELARYICNHTDDSGYELAVALDTQPGISMDTKILAIFSHV